MTSILNMLHFCVLTNEANTNTHTQKEKRKNKIEFLVYSFPHSRVVFLVLLLLFSFGSKCNLQQLEAPGFSPSFRWEMRYGVEYCNV